MKQKIKSFINNNPKKLKVGLKLFNYTAGRNKIKMHKKTTFTVGAVYMRNTSIIVKGINNTIIIEDLTRLNNCSIYIKGNNNRIVISKKTNLLNTEFYIEDSKNSIFIGEETVICGATHLAAIEGTQIFIGNNCLFSSDIHFRTGDSHSITDLNGKRINPSENIYIGNHVWIGTKVIIMKGSHIEDDCIVGAGSLVTKNFSETNVILAGNPARIVKREINWLIERI